jgi:hypothetical protein
MIYRTQRDSENPYFMLRRKTAQDTNLTWNARGILAYLFSKPDSWNPTLEDLIKQTSGSRNPLRRDGVRNALAELEEKGYIVRRQERRSGGTLGDWACDIYESPRPVTPNPSPVTPQTTPVTPEPATAQPATANTTLDNTDRTKDYRGEEKQQQQSPDAQADRIAAAAALPASAFSLEVVKSYVVATKPHAKNPGGLAVHLCKSGEDDEEIAAWLEPQERREAERTKRILRIEEYVRLNDDWELLESDRDFILANRTATPTFAKLAELAVESLRSFLEESQAKLPDYLQLQPKSHHRGNQR